MAIDETRAFKPINIALLTVSDTRGPENDTSGDILAEIMQEMPVIMQEARDDDLRSFPSLLSEGGALQGMLKFCDVLSVAAMPLGFEDSEDFGDDRVCVGRGHG
jgi:hypothetical protein